MTETAANSRPSWRDVLHELDLVEQRLNVRMDATEQRLSALIEAMDKRLADFELAEAVRARRISDLMAVVGGVRGLMLTIAAVGGLVLGIANLA